MEQMNNDLVYDVIISGAGPVGLFLACELALAECSVLILEKAASPHSPLKQLPFGMRGLSAPTIEALYRRGLLQEMAVPKRQKDPFPKAPDTAGQTPRRPAGHFAGMQFFHDSIDTTQWTHRLPGSTDTSLLSEMAELEMVLARRAEALGVEIRRGLATTEVLQDQDGVTVRSGELSFQGRWLVGCDGARSTVRKAGGFDFAGTEPEFTGYTTQLDIADPDKLRPGRNFTATGMYFQSQPGYLVMQDFDGGAFHGLDQAVTREHVQALLRRISGTDVSISALHVGATWTDRARQATRYRNGRILLAGDAAHIHSPLGGQGLNLGLGDAMNLGWKLAATIQGRAPQGLLDSYQAERHPVGAQVLDWSRAQVAIMRPDPHARAVNAIVRDLMNTRDGATYFAARVWGIGTHYDLGGGHPLAGYSVPNFAFDDGSSVGDWMGEGQGMLLDFGASAALQTLAGEYGGRMKYMRCRATDQLGLSAVLIRPDGIVAWAAEGEANAQSAREAAARWFA
jgi:2-polyprenyl-6-methoxyphenol hydroxylase-like FAD-dependent oxidoreductase